MFYPDVILMSPEFKSSAGAANFCWWATWNRMEKGKIRIDIIRFGTALHLLFLHRHIFPNVVLVHSI
jgi:hypothetical protein